jgi:tripartite-type tricarboxylate transporter receptor subunit TctC
MLSNDLLPAAGMPETITLRFIRKRGNMHQTWTRYMIQKINALSACIAAALLAASVARAQDYPTSNIRIVVPFTAGGGVDVVARKMAQQLSEKLGRTVYVENKPGASGNIGALSVAQASSDGYTLLISASTFAVNPIVSAEHLPFDPVNDFTQLALLAKGPLLFIVHPDAASSVQDFIAKAKATPDKYNFGTGGYGSAGHMSAEALKLRGKLDIPVILYKGTGPAFTDLIGGHISGILDPLITSLPLAKSGKVKALAISDDKHSPLAPEVPTFAEAGLGNFVFYTWYGLWGPAHLPPAVAGKIEAAVRDVGNSPDVQKWLASQGLEFSGISGTEFVDFEKGEQNKYDQIMKDGKIARQ